MELTIDQALQKSIEAHRTGQFQEADKLYTAILKAQPKHPDANHNMGVLSIDAGKVQESIPFFKIALESNPNKAQFWLSYIDTLIKLDRLLDAKAVLDELRQSQRGRPRYLFPSEGSTGHLNVDTLRWDGFSPKVCRATARTLLQSLGCPLEERSRITHHSHQTKLERAYDKHLYRDEVTHWWQALGEKLTMLEPGYRLTGNVIPKRKRTAK